MAGQSLKSNYQYPLIKETHELGEARELLMALMAAITRFHTLNASRTWERTGANDELSNKRIEELSKLRENILEMFKEIEGETLSIEINVEVKVAENA